MFKGKNIAIMGLGKTGFTSAVALKKMGANIFAWDDDEEKRKSFKDENKNIDIINLEQIDFTKIDLLLSSPSISYLYPKPHPVIKKAIDTNTEIVNDIEILRRLYPNTDIIAISGTNGKSTTTSLISHILKDYRDVKSGGNLGIPVLGFKPPKENTTYILEISSFQLERISHLNANAAILLNITADHLEHHGGIEGYIKAKENLFNKNNDSKSYAIIVQDDEYCRKITENLGDNWKKIPVSSSKKQKGSVYIEDNYLIDDLSGNAKKVLNLNKAKSLRGKHNHQNMVSSYAAAKILYNIPSEEIAERIISFKGLPHRQYLVKTINGVAYVNDSKATNADATAKALDTYNNIYWIVGGKPKQGGLNGLQKYMNKIKNAFLIGESSEEFAKWFDNHNVPYMRCSVMETAVREAHAMAQDERGAPGGAGTVLLSPACASFDQYQSFEERGNKFEEIVNICAMEENL